MMSNLKNGWPFFRRYTRLDAVDEADEQVQDSHESVSALIERLTRDVDDVPSMQRRGGITEDELIPQLTILKEVIFVKTMQSCGLL